MPFIIGGLTLVAVVAIVAVVRILRRGTASGALSADPQRPAQSARGVVPSGQASTSQAIATASTPALPPATSIAGASRTATTHVLIVDDSAIMRTSLAALFGQAGFRTASVEDGGAAVRWVQRHGMPPLVTLDMEMPGMSGMDTLRALHDLPGEPKVQAVFVTTRAHERIREAATQLGALAFFSKPYNSADLLAVAHQAACGSPAQAMAH